LNLHQLWDGVRERDVRRVVYRTKAGSE
jgi:hypothetical protein